MPKRVVDGEALWTSDKLAEVQPPEYRAEFANLLSLSLANGVFECDPAKVYRAVYAYNRPDRTREDVATILAEFERVKMLFRWREPDGKWWGHFVGIDKPGRLPADSRKDREKLGPEPPPEELREFLNAVPGRYPEGSRSVPGAYPGKGNGSGFGSGSGSCMGQGYGEQNLETETVSPAPHTGAYSDEPSTRSTINRVTSPEKNLTTRINQMLDVYPRQCADDETRAEWYQIFEGEVAALAEEFFRGDVENALKFVEGSFAKFSAKRSAKQKDPKYAWGPKKFFEQWVREEHDLKRLKTKQQPQEEDRDSDDSDDPEGYLAKMETKIEDQDDDFFG